VPNAHRVLRVDGTVSPGFRWVDPGVDTEPLDVLRAEGVEFDEHGRANANQRMTTVELAQLLAIDVEDPASGKGPMGGNREQKFFAQLDEFQPDRVVHGVRRIFDRWVELGERSSSAPATRRRASST
jgi:hypothetical protein